MECYTYLRNVTDLLSDGKTPYERRCGKPFEGPIIPFGSLVEYHPITSKDQSRIHQFGKKVLPGLFLGYALYAEGIWKGDVLVADLEELETMDASEIYSKSLNAKEVIFLQKGEFTFPIADGRNKTPGGDQDLRTSTLIRPRPIQGEGHVDFLGESEGSLPQPHDSLPVAGEAMHDFWSMSGSLIYRHHVEPRVELYSPREESFPIPLKYIDVTRTTHTNLCQAREAHRWLLEYWWLSRLVWSLDRFHTIYSTRWKSSWRIYLVRGETNEKTAYIQARSSMARVMEVNGKERQAEEKAKMGWRKDSSWPMQENCVESISLTPRIRSTRKPSRTRVRNWKRQLLLLCPAKLWRIVGVADLTKTRQNLRVFWKPMNPPECVWGILNLHITKTILQEKVRIHCNITIWFTNLFLCLKLWKSQQQKQQWTRNGKNWRKFRRGIWPKSKVRKKWSMKQGRRSLQFILHH